MIKLYQFPEIWGLPNASPFCLKIETYLRMTELPYENRFVRDPRKAPKGKLPFVKCENTIIADSEFIIAGLKQQFGDLLDKHLSIEQKALAVLLDNVFSERLYWLMFYFRWQDEQGWKHVKPSFFAGLPWILNLFLPNLIRKKTIKTLYMQGTGRHNREDALQLAQTTIRAIADTLGDKPYFMGNEVSTIDASAFAFLANIVWMPYDDPLKIIVQKHQNILHFCDRMWQSFYPELKQPFRIV
ncbi:glutathione S-transferase family protein [Legionella genomosp. 1]|uniref:glutathione S-transferase family protein n=1 Tax=Legionella genomosp. 1 TaxID=1093625 RepID=UPI0013EF9A96|nr:glutathione S-transferase family protein [Legionella genomosp. 1]